MEGHSEARCILVLLFSCGILNGADHWALRTNRVDKSQSNDKILIINENSEYDDEIQYYIFKC